nr:MAG TPA: hypothetical protein [Caudoviricetes sp.]
MKKCVAGLDKIKFLVYNINIRVRDDLYINNAFILVLLKSSYFSKFNSKCCFYLTTHNPTEKSLWG